MRVLMALALMLLPANLGFAAEVPKMELFGGYCFVRSAAGDEEAVNMNGWNLALNARINEHLLLVIEGAGTYGSQGETSADVSTHTIMAGPQLLASSCEECGTIRAFARVLLGVARSRVDVRQTSSSDGGFAFAVGGGVDLRVIGNIMIRPVQLDYERVYTFEEPADNVRYSAGIVLPLM
ncbi:MAG: outer membrane beta-barrel protein [Acidobacteriota bacterium]